MPAKLQHAFANRGQSIATYSIQMGDTLEIPLSIINVPIQPYMPYRQKI
ncbi:hypothetical protein ACFVHQ_02495 [Actinomycetes bacterium NPDC127524]